jgi:hypothetical protein
LPRHHQIVLDAEDAAHFACAHFRDLPVCGAIDHPEEHRSAVFSR